jgi:hypothetical protein
LKALSEANDQIETLQNKNEVLKKKKNVKEEEA